MSPEVEFVAVVVGAPIVLFVGLFVAKRPVTLLAVYAAIVPFGSAIALPLPFLPSSLRTLTSIVGGAVIARLGWEYVTQGVRIRLPSRPVGLWGVYLSIAVASVAWSIRPGETAGGLMAIGSLVLLFALVAVYPASTADLARVGLGVVVGAVATGYLGLAMAATGSLPRSAAGVPRFEITGAGGGEGGDPNITAAALLLGLAIALDVVNSSDSPFRTRLFHIHAAIVISAGIALTASRGGLVGVALIVALTLRRRSQIRIIALLVGAMLAVTMAFPEALLLRLGDTDTTGRAGIWRNALVACPDHCLLGAGYDTFPDLNRSVYLSDPAASANRPRYEAHSIWIESLLELGVAGLLTLAFALATMAGDLLRMPQHARRGSLAALLALVFTNSFVSNLSFKYFWLVLMYAAFADSAWRNGQIPTRELDRVRSG